MDFFQVAMELYKHGGLEGILGCEKAMGGGRASENYYQSLNKEVTVC